MGNAFSRTNTADPGAGKQVPAGRQAEQEPRRIGITGAGGINQGVHHLSVDYMDLIAGNNNRALFAARKGRDFAMAANRLQGIIKILDLIESHDFFFIGEQDIDMVLRQVEEFFAVTVDAKWVR